MLGSVLPPDWAREGEKRGGAVGYGLDMQIKFVILAIEACDGYLKMNEEGSFACRIGVMDGEVGTAL